MNKETLEKKIESALYAGIVGDALGVPVEFSTRQELALCSVKNMVGYGRYDEPEGTWSDDTSLTLCTIESLLQGYNLENLAQTFCKWLFESYWTPSGYVFDAGLTTFLALDRIRNDNCSPLQSGCNTVDDNGNGSLMRMVAPALYFYALELDEFLEKIHEISAITHAHERAKIGCGYYSLFMRALLAGDEKKDALHKTNEIVRAWYSEKSSFKEELTHFERILSGKIETVDKNEIGSSGYIVDTLEASVWCFLRGNSSKDIILEAVNLGLDTDTTGMVAGGMTGLYYGLDSIPEQWMASLARKQELDTLIHSFVKKVSDNTFSA